MTDPVKLPTSGNTVDRTTIKRILLNDEHDPFNRAPLTFEQVEDDVEMKQRIQRWIEQKRNGEVTDEEKRQQEEEKQEEQVMEVQKEESHMSVDPPAQPAPTPPQASVPAETHDSLMDRDPESLTEEEQIQLAMQMSMGQFQ